MERVELRSQVRERTSPLVNLVRAGASPTVPRVFASGLSAAVVIGGLGLLVAFARE